MSLFELRSECSGGVAMKMKSIRQVAGLFCLLTAGTVSASAAVHVWEKQEVTLTSARSWANAYTDATVWVDLTGPNFKKRVYGFWDGGQTFRVRILATAPGTWTDRKSTRLHSSHLGISYAVF